MNILNCWLFSAQKPDHRCSTGLYAGFRKYWNLQSEAKVEQVIAIVTTRSISCFNFITNDVEGLKLSTKTNQISWIFYSKLTPSSVLFAQETHLFKEIEQKWKNELNGQICFSHGKSNLCGVFIAFLAVNQ